MWLRINPDPFFHIIELAAHKIPIVKRGESMGWRKNRKWKGETSLSTTLNMRGLYCPWNLFQMRFSFRIFVSMNSVSSFLFLFLFHFPVSVSFCHFFFFFQIIASPWEMVEKQSCMHQSICREYIHWVKHPYKRLLVWREMFALRKKSIDATLSLVYRGRCAENCGNSGKNSNGGKCSNSGNVRRKKNLKKRRHDQNSD